MLDIPLIAPLQSRHNCTMCRDCQCQFLSSWKKCDCHCSVQTRIHCTTFFKMNRVQYVYVWRTYTWYISTYTYVHMYIALMVSCWLQDNPTYCISWQKSFASSFANQKIKDYLCAPGISKSENQQVSKISKSKIIRLLRESANQKISKSEKQQISKSRIICLLWPTRLPTLQFLQLICLNE